MATEGRVFSLIVAIVTLIVQNLYSALNEQSIRLLIGVLIVISIIGILPVFVIQLR